MMRILFRSRNFIGAVICILLLVSCSNDSNNKLRPIPNILIFLADDMGIGDISTYQRFTSLPDSLQLHTPTIDQLAERGTLFLDAHSEASLCSPSRWSLMTGTHVWRRNDIGYRLMQLKNRSFLDNEATLPEMLKRSGYMCYGVGKWHMGVTIEDSIITHSPLEHGFDHYVGVRHNHNNGYWRQKFLLNDHELSHLNEKGDLVKGAGYVPSELLSQIWLDQSRKYLSEHKTGELHAGQPFFLYYSPHANHEPYLPAKHLDGIAVKNQARTISGEPATLTLDSINDSPLFEKHGISSIHRGDMVFENDVALGRLLAWLEETEDPRYEGHQMIENTIIILASDNGSDVRKNGAPSNGHLTGHKNTQFEGGHHIPLIIYWADKPPEGEINTALFSLTDIFTTHAAVSGTELEADEAIDSENVLSWWLDEPDSEILRKKPLVTLGGRAFPDDPDGEGGKDWLSVRKGDLKLTVMNVDFEQGSFEPVGLYNLEKSIKETSGTNLLEDHKYIAELDSMKKTLRSVLINEEIQTKE